MVDAKLNEHGKLEYAEGEMHAQVDLRCYRLSAIQKAAYRVADRCTVIFSEVGDHHVAIRLSFRTATSEADAREGTRVFFEELLDQELREKIGEETAPLRSLLLAQAFSRTDLIKRG